MKCVKVDRKTRLKIKKKLSIIINFNMPSVFCSSPARAQFMNCRDTFRGFQLYPYNSDHTITLRLDDEPRRYFRNDLWRRHSSLFPSLNLYYYTSGNHILYLAEDDNDAQFIIIKKVLQVSNDKCYLSITFAPKNLCFDFSLFIKYHKTSNRLSIYTNTPNFNFNMINLLKVVDEMILHSLMF